MIDNGKQRKKFALIRLVVIKNEEGNKLQFTITEGKMIADEELRTYDLAKKH